MKPKERESGPVNIRGLESDKELEADHVGKLEPDEVKLVGAWESEESRIAEDPNTKRINWLTENYLRKVSADESG